LSERQSTADPITTREPIGDNPVKTKTSRKPRAIKKVIGGDEPIVKKPRKPRAKKVVDAEPNAALAEKPPRKPRAKKDATEIQSKMPKGRVTKASTGSRTEKAAGKKRTPVVSSHFASAAMESTDPFDVSNISENDLLLQEAVKRRRCWTPPKTTTDPSSITITPAEKDGEAPSLSSVSGDKQKTITDLFRNFGYSHGRVKAGPELVIDQLGTKKRKLIELVNMNNTAVKTPVSKVKATKKKPRTITELATSAYAADANKDDAGILPARMLQQFPYKDTASADKIPGISDGFKVPPKRRSKSPTKAASKAFKPKKGMAQAPILLSPQAALKRVEKQQFVFGTSSQLAREDSPTLLRDLQQAMRASNQVEDDPFADIVEGLSPSKSASITERGTGVCVAKRNLWAAASRGIDGALTDIETIDMSESPQVLPTSKQKPSVPVSDQRGIMSDSTSIRADDEWHDLDADNSPVKENSRKDEQTSAKVGPVEAAIRLELRSNPARVNETRRPLSSKATVSASKPPAKTDGPSKLTSAPQKPDYGSYPTTKLAKEIASYHFKPIKGRDQMISLLERCWEGRHKIAANSSENPQEAEISAFVSNKPLALRQTPKKQKKKASPIPEEIYDSDSPLTPSPTRRRTKVHTPPLPLKLPVSEEPDESLLLSPTSQQLRLHKHITRAITTAPPSKDPKNPSWHEKILLYDPIILEDLAAWLNTGALEKVGWDGEVDPKEVKRWCLEKSICCLWRENLKGAARSRY
jgi:Slx4 endonuclease